MITVGATPPDSTAGQYDAVIKSGQGSNQVTFKTKYSPLDVNRENAMAHPESVGLPASMIKQMLVKNNANKVHPFKLNTAYKIK